MDVARERSQPWGSIEAVWQAEEGSIDLCKRDEELEDGVSREGWLVNHEMWLRESVSKSIAGGRQEAPMGDVERNTVDCGVRD